MDSIKKRISDRIYRIIWIEGPSAQKYLAAGEKNLINPVKPACPMESFCPIPSGSQKKIKIESIQHSVPLYEKILRRICYRNYE